MGTKKTALELLNAGWSVIPIKPNGSKAPAVPAWNPYRTKKATTEEIHAWFDRVPTPGIGLVCGAISGVIVIDFDAPGLFDEWRTIVEDVAPGLLDHCVIVQTPKGYGRHVYARRDAPEEGQKLARAIDDEGAIGTLIETRGEGNYVLAPGSPEACHPSGRTYEHVEGIALTDLPAMDPIDDESFEVMIGVALSFNQYVSAAKTVGQKKAPPRLGGGVRPGDAFNERGSWEDILHPAGWKLIRQGRDGKCGWQRPGKPENDRSISATTGYCTNKDGDDLLFVFSSNAQPFEPERAYAKFSAYAMLIHGGDYAGAARALSKAGYGERGKAPTVDELRPLFEAAMEKLRPMYEAVKVQKDTAGLSSLDPAKLKAATENFPVFKRTWERKRDDYTTLDLHEMETRYFIGLVHFGVRFRWTPEEIAQLVFDFFCRHNPEYLTCYGVDELAEKSAWFYAHPLSPDTDGIVEFESASMEAGAMDRSDIVEDLRQRLGVPVARWVKTEREEGIFSLIMEDNTRVEIGCSSTVMSAGKFEARLYGRTDMMLPDGVKRTIEWRKVLRMLASIVDVEDVDFDSRKQTLEYIDEYFYARERASEKGEEGWQVSLPGNHPFLRDSEIYVHAGAFRKWINYAHAEKLKLAEVRKMLRNAGFESNAVSARVGGKVYSKHYWRLSVDEMPRRDPDGEECEAVSTSGSGEGSQEVPF